MSFFKFRLGSLVLCSVLSLLAHLCAPVIIKTINGNAKLKDPPYHYVIDISLGCRRLPEITKRQPIVVIAETCVMLYQNTICMDSNGEATYIHGQKDHFTDSELPAGYSSIGPCESKTKNSASDYLTKEHVSIPKLAKLHVKIYRAELIKHKRKVETTLTLRPQVVVENRGLSSFIQEYKANITIQEFLKIRIPEWTQNVTTIKVFERVEFKEKDTENQFGPFVNVVNIQKHIETIFTKTSENNKFASVYSVVQSQNFNVDKSISVAACSKYNMTSSLKVNYVDVGLQLYLIVTGVDVQGQYISSKILKDMLPKGLYYVGLGDEYDVEGISRCYVETEYGNTLEISIKGSKISNC